MELSLDKLKALLGKTSSEEDVVLQFILDDVSETVLNYCNVVELPPGLENVCYRMAVDVYRAERLGAAEAPGFVTSIKEGDTSVNYSPVGSVAAYAGSVLKNYTVSLNRFRKLGAPCCH